MTKVVKNTIVLLIPLSILAVVTVLSLMHPDKLPGRESWLARIPYADKAVHFFFYFALVSAARLARTHFGKYTPACRWRLLIFAALYGGAIELLQGAYFDRGCDIWDEAADVFGAFVALWWVPQAWYDRLKSII
jgi:VanZ family protein